MKCFIAVLAVLATASAGWGQRWTAEAVDRCEENKDSDYLDCVVVVEIREFPGWNFGDKPDAVGQYIFVNGSLTVDRILISSQSPSGRDTESHVTLTPLFKTGGDRLNASRRLDFESGYFSNVKCIEMESRFDPRGIESVSSRSPGDSPDWNTHIKNQLNFDCRLDDLRNVRRTRHVYESMSYLSRVQHGRTSLTEGQEPVMFSIINTSTLDVTAILDATRQDVSMTNLFAQNNGGASPASEVETVLNLDRRMDQAQEFEDSEVYTANIDVDVFYIRIVFQLYYRGSWKTVEDWISDQEIESSTSQPTSKNIFGDWDGDGDIDLVDFREFARCFGHSSENPKEGCGQ